MVKITEYGVNPWHPESDPVSLKHLGKLGEECGELNAALNRCIIQGIEGCEPVTFKSNRIWLEEEIADVLANIELNVEHFDLDRQAIDDRKERKKFMLRRWHEMV